MEILNCTVMLNGSILSVRASENDTLTISRPHAQTHQMVDKFAFHTVVYSYEQRKWHMVFPEAYELDDNLLKNLEEIRIGTQKVLCPDVVIKWSNHHWRAKVYDPETLPWDVYIEEYLEDDYHFDCEEYFFPEDGEKDYGWGSERDGSENLWELIGFAQERVAEIKSTHEEGDAEVHVQVCNNWDDTIYFYATIKPDGTIKQYDFTEEKPE